MEQITVKRRETLLAVTEEPERVIEIKVSSVTHIDMMRMVIAKSPYFL